MRCALAVVESVFFRRWKMYPDAFRNEYFKSKNKRVRGTSVVIDSIMPKGLELVLVLLLHLRSGFCYIFIHLLSTYRKNEEMGVMI